MALAPDTALQGTVLEALLCARSFPHFLRRVRLEEPGSGAVAFEPWPHLVEAAEILLQNRLIAWLKARQIGASWLLASYACWVSMHRPAALVLMFSQGQREAWELLRKARTVYRLLPDHLKAPLVSENQEALNFQGGGRILAFPSTEQAGQGYTATLVIMDEADHHPYFQANLETVKPTIDAGGQLVVVSTADPGSLDSTFKRLYRMAPGNGYTPLFYSWQVRPGRDQKWYDDVMRAATDRALAEKQYPESADQALAPSQTVAAFDLPTLTAMRGDLRVPVDSSSPVSVWQRYIVGQRYAAFTDTSHGVGRDDSVTALVRVETGTVVADVVSNVMSPEEFALHSFKLLEKYEQPVWGIEDNDWGRVVLGKARELGYRHLYERKPDVPGWLTGHDNRETLWGELIEAVKARAVVMHSEYGLKQMFQVIRNAKKQGRIEAVEGGKDDYPWALAGAWQMRKHATGATGRMVAVPSRWTASPRNGRGAR